MSGIPPIEPKLLGELAVVIIKAKNLPDRSKIGKHNPYVVVQYRQEKRKSKVVKKGGQHPEFDDEVRFKIYEETEDILARPPRSSDPPLQSICSTSIGSNNATSIAPTGAASEAMGTVTKRLPLNKSIQVTVWADDSKEPRIVGECSVDLAEVFRTCEQDDSYELQYKNRYAGEISLELTYFINDAPPIPKKVVKPVIPAKPTHSNSITSISTIATFDGPAGFPLKGSTGSATRRRPVEPAYGSGSAGYAAGGNGNSVGAAPQDPRYQQYYQGSVGSGGGGHEFGGLGGMDEWGVRPHPSTSSSMSISGLGGSHNQHHHQGQQQHHDHHHRQSFSGRPTSTTPGYDPYSHQSSIDSLGGSLAGLSIASHGPSMPFPTATPHHQHQNTPPPPPLPPASPVPHSQGHRYSMSGAIPQSSSWNGNPAANGGNYQPPPSSSYGTLPPLPPPPLSLPTPPSHRMGNPPSQQQQGYGTQVVPSSSFPQLYPPEPFSQPSRTPVSTDYTTQSSSSPALMPWQTPSVASSSNNDSNTYQQRPASTNPGGYIPSPLIDNRPPPRPSSQPMNPPVNVAYGQPPPPPPPVPPGGHYPLPTSSFHYSSTTPAPGLYGDTQGRPLPMPSGSTGSSYQSDQYGQPPPPPPPQGDWRNPANAVGGEPSNGYQGGYADYAAPPPTFQPQYDQYQQQSPYSYHQNPPNNQWAPEQVSAYPSQTAYPSQPPMTNGGLGVPPAPPPRPHSPPAPSNVLTDGFAAARTGGPPQTQGAGRSFLSNLGVGGEQATSRQQQFLPPGGGYGLPPRLPDSLLGGSTGR